MTDKEMTLFLLGVITKIIGSLNLLHNTTDDVSLKFSLLEIIKKTNEELRSVIK